MRAGGQTLTFLSSPRIFLILQALRGGAKARLELRRAAGSPAQSTMRGHISALETVGAIAKRKPESGSGNVEYELTEPGLELLAVAAGLTRWLAGAPNGPLELGADLARAAVKGLVEGWSAAVMDLLSAGPLSLTELNKQISAVSYPTLERCLETMRLAEEIEALPRSNRGTPYEITTWLRRGIAPLAYGAHWESRHRPEGAEPIRRMDIAAALDLAAPLLDPRTKPSGTCLVSVRNPADGTPQRFEGTIEVRDGRASFGPVYPKRKPNTWASGGVENWFGTLLHAEPRGIKLSGDRRLLEAAFDALRKALFDDSGSGTVKDPMIPK